MFNNDSSKQPAERAKNGRSQGNALAEGRISAPAINLPKGGGALQGIGEKFQVNAVTGTGSLTVPLAISPGRGGFGPQLALSYDSGAGNSPFGLGWNVGVASIRRKTQKGLPQYYDGEESDVFILSGAEDLVPTLAEQADGNWQREIIDDDNYAPGHTVYRYRPRIEGLFARIERWVRHSDNDTHWRAITGDNRTTIYGLTPGERISHPTEEWKVFEWLIERTYDDKGNIILYQYKAEDSANVEPEIHEINRLHSGEAFTQTYLKRIFYGNSVPYRPQLPGFDETTWANDNVYHFQIVFDFNEHTADSPAPQEETTWSVRDDPFSNYRAGFEIRTYRLCRRVLMFHQFPELGPDWTLVRSTDFTHDENLVATQLREVVHWSYETGQEPAPLPAVRFSYTAAEIDDNIYTVAEEDLENMPQGLGGPYRWLDLDGEGLSGIFSQYDQAWYYKRNLGNGHFGLKEVVGFVPSVAAPGDARQQFVDLGGDGRQNLVLFSAPLSGFYEWPDLQTADSFYPFESVPNVNWGDPNLRLIDLNGDGHADIMVTEHDCRVCYPSLAKAGFAAAQVVAQALDEEQGPRVVFADVSQAIVLADMSGDGLTDIVRIENGSVCYWPNTGYGTFGARVSMGNAPLFDHPDYFTPTNTRLGDIDGSGTTDIFYLGHDGLRYWFNQAGNSWSDAQELVHFPPADRLTSVDIVDFLGNGTACIVWSSSLPGDQGRQVRYIPLMSQLKPYLLAEIDNNSGGLTRLQYAPSTRFYLEDRLNGRPWITKLPFPVHVLECMETFDQITGTAFVSRYVYHHGYFDGDEREFRGFGMVEQYDTEDFVSFGQNRLFDVDASNWTEDSHVPPVYSKSWFHTGFYLDRAHISQQYADEYYQGDPDSVNLPDTILPPDLAADEIYEACRALKGSLLRQEVYALDDNDHAADPYTVTETSYIVRREQPRGENRHGVFFVHQRESLAYHYERNPADPRLAHSLTLAVDAYGNPTRTASVVYPRRGPGHPAEQQQLWISYQEADFIHLDQTLDGYRIGLPFESRSYELTGLDLPPTGLFTPAGLLADATTAGDIPYEAMPDPSQSQRRLLRRSRTRYYNGELNAALPFGQAALHGLAFESYQLVFSTTLLDFIYQDRVNEAMLLEGGFQQLADQGNDLWWAASGRLIFDPDHFFLPVQHLDPFGAVTSLTYDVHDLLLLDSEDPLHNRVTAGMRDTQGNITSGLDYRLLLPDIMTGPNGTRTRLAFDVRGLVIATAISGTAGEGDTLDDPTTRFEYDLFNWQNNGRPNFAHTFARERHGLDNPRWQESYLYTGGLGQEILTKVQAEPGLAFVRDDHGDLLLDANGEPLMAHSDERWVGNGRIILGNKGNPVRQYEPYFSSTHDYEDEDELREFGVSPTLHYDPVGRNIRTDFPDGSLARVEFTPWLQIGHDQNDTVLESDWYVQRGSPNPAGLEPSDPATRAAWLAAQHAGTLTCAHFDSLGRPFVSIAHNIRNGTDEFVPTHTVLNIEGNPLEIYDGRNCEGLSLEAVVDHLGNRVMAYRYAMGGLQVHEDSMDGGERWLLVNVVGNPLYSWDSRDHRFRTRYDALQRPVASHAQTGQEPEQLVGLTIFGEQHPDAEALYLRGQPFQVYDQAGLVTSEGVDFKENLLRSSRRLAQEYRETVDWLSLENFLDATTLDLDALEDAAAPLLEEDESFVTETEFDALNRPIELRTPDGSRHRPEYNEASFLERLTVQVRGQGNFVPFVENIDYNEKGQRLLIQYGNGVETSYSYDEQTYRLIHLYTRRGPSFTEDCGGEPPPPRFAAPVEPPEGQPCGLQNLHYAYDPVGNVTEIRDDAQQTIFFANQAVQPHCRYVYDALYRLIEAHGREHIGQTTNQPRTDADVPIQPLPHPNNPQAMRTYTERYDYDPVGNILAMIHQAADGNWTRDYDYEPNNNRLLGHGGATPDYAYDPHGSMTRMPHLPLMQWNFADQPQASSRQVANTGTPETTYYVYDAAGQRVRKVNERFQPDPNQEPTRRNERLYLGGFEIYREYNGNGNTIILERETLHVMDDTQRIALVETRTQGNDGLPSQSIRCQLGNHLGSAVLEVDDLAAVIAYEEFHPYGTSAYRAGRSQAEVSLNRYRYTGQERDEETALYYHGARYYACWLGRWTAADPIGIGDGTNQYVYVGGNPITKIDLTGQYQSFWDKLVDLEDAVVGGLARAGEAVGTIAGDAADIVESTLDSAIEVTTSYAVEGGAVAYETFGGDQVSEETKAEVQSSLADAGKLVASGPSGALRYAGAVVETTLEAPRQFDRAVQTTARGIETGNAERVVAGLGGTVEHGSVIAATVAGASGLAKAPRPAPHPRAQAGMRVRTGVRAGANNGGSSRPGSVSSPDTVRSAMNLPPRPVVGPSPRHSANKVTQSSPKKEANTVIDPRVDVASDVAAVNSGRGIFGTLPKTGERTVLVNGRIYGIKPNGRLYPVAGPGFTSLSRGGYEALSIFNKLGPTPKAFKAMNQRKTPIPVEDQAQALKVWAKTQQ